MGKYSGILLCTDFDGTLEVSRSVSKENMEAIRYFSENGGIFTFASGRYYEFLLENFPKFNFKAPILALNGAVFYDTVKQKIIRERFMTGLTYDYIESIFDNVIGLEEAILYTKEGFKHFNTDNLNTLRSVPLSDVYKIQVKVEYDIDVSNKAVEALRAMSPSHWDIARSWYPGIGVQDKANTKGPATRDLANMLGADKLVCVGDFENDIGMVKGADIGYAVANSIDSLKAVADRVTVSAKEHAIAKIIEEL